MENLNKVHGCFLGVMIGDALGAPVEMMNPENILAQNDGKPITGFLHSIRRKEHKSEVVKPIKNSSKFIKLPFLDNFKNWIKSNKKNIDSTKEKNVTITTDDWQLTNAVCQSLIRRGKFDITDMALSHVEAYEISTSGWGGTTRESLKELQEYFKSLGNRGRSPTSAPVPIFGRGSGNGIAMKVSPLALMHSLKGADYESLATEVADLGRLTHSDPRAWAAAYAVAYVLIESSKLHDAGLLNSNNRIEILKSTLQHLSTFERKYGSGGLKRFSSYLKVLLDSSLLFGPIENLREKVGTGCIAIESVVFALAVFLRNPFYFEKAILEAVNSGGDSDTCASIVGGLIGSLVGPNGIPLEWRKYSLEFEESEKVAKEFYSVFNKS